MILIPGIVISLLTFPGIIVHEFAHQFICWLLKIPVMQVCYFRLAVRGPAGFVIHARPSSGWASLAIGFGPLLVNTILGMLITLSATLHAMVSVNDPLDYLLLWLGVSIAMHSFPSAGDAQSIWKSVTGPSTSILEKIVAVPLIGLIMLGAIGSVFWLDVGYGILMGRFVPEWIIRAIA